MASLRHWNAVVLDRMAASLLCAVESLEGHEPGGVEQEGVQVLSMDSSMERRLGATPLDFRQQILHLLNGHQNLKKDRNIRKITDYSFVNITQLHCIWFGSHLI